MGEDKVPLHGTITIKRPNVTRKTFMAQSTVRSSVKLSPQPCIAKPPDFAARRLRRVGAWLLLSLALLAGLGRVWSVCWLVFLWWCLSLLRPSSLLVCVVVGV